MLEVKGCNNSNC